MPVCLWNQALIPTCLVEPVSQHQQRNADEAAPPSKKAAKKVEAKARKEALKAQRAEARQAPSSAVELDDPAKGFYGQAPTTPIVFSSSAEDISFRNFSDGNVEGKSIILRA
ncbi:hypothetical protein QC764_0069270 [Podospora pseudoanserina]|uniref:Uncharacterized protein n=1 Tax=Podospora pseudoanserina TaxID=2609844 RepID=A0ABR0IAP4_9PEZI|nr:hypothetical protein QC764_0069270 [Podospora pseudoanserina]